MEQQSAGAWQNTKYVIKHRNTNSVLEIYLNPGDVVKSKPGAMVHMSPTVALQGKIKVSFKKLFTGAMMDESHYTGPGVVALAPRLMGDITPIQIDQANPWSIHKDAWLACTADILRDTKSQGFKRAFGGGGDLFPYHVTGNGIVWVESYGALESIELQPGQQHVIEHGHLVAWNCQYTIGLAGGQGLMNALKTEEGTICTFTGPGVVYYATRNLEQLADWVRTVAGAQ